MLTFSHRVDGAAAPDRGRGVRVRPDDPGRPGAVGERPGEGLQGHARHHGHEQL